MGGMKTLKNRLLVMIFIVPLFGCSPDPEFAEEQPLEVPIPVASKFSQIIDQKAISKKVDLLIVVDNSTSMSRDQEKLSREFKNFVSSIEAADYRIGVITTDIQTVNKENEEGFYGNLAIVESTGKRYISKDDPNPSALFAELVKRKETVSCLKPNGYTKPNCVSFDEKPLFAIKMAIDKRKTVNSGFFREDADLGIVIITDEDETAFKDKSVYTAEKLLEDFENEFGITKRLTAFTITILEGDEACYKQQRKDVHSDSAVSYGVRVSELASLTGGFSINICDQFSKGLELISAYVEKDLLPLRIKVPELIILHSIVLTITQPNGSPFETDFTVEGGVLRISPLPPEGSKIELEYSFDL